MYENFKPGNVMELNLFSNSRAFFSSFLRDIPEHHVIIGSFHLKFFGWCSPSRCQHALPYLLYTHLQSNPKTVIRLASRILSSNICKLHLHLDLSFKNVAKILLCPIGCCWDFQNNMPSLKCLMENIWSVADWGGPGRRVQGNRKTKQNEEEVSRRKAKHDLDKEEKFKRE